MTTQYTLKRAGLDQVDVEGKVLRSIGIMEPNIAGLTGADTVALTTAGSGFARTNVPKTRGSKRFFGFWEARLLGGLWVNVVIDALAQAVFEWLDGPGGEIVSNLVAGVLSTTLQQFVAFSGSGAVTNIAGTQVTRKPLRGE
jgi:hypothetical protein